MERMERDRGNHGEDASPVQEREIGRAAALMLQGTASDVGKSLLTAAFCRIFKQDGKRVAPFKSQNMSLNSYVTPDGKEIGRAQGMQADASGIAATTDMNPILLKPKKDMIAQVVVHGKPLGDLSARDYRERYLPEAELIVKEALARLRGSYEVIVLEGAGSPAEVNLKDRDIVNMRLAAWADAPVLLVADIDRGGVFASVVGTMEILEPEERDRVCGVIINKFRGDVSLLQPGLDWLEARIGKPVLGVVPYLDGLQLEDEDGASLDAKGYRWRAATAQELEIAIIRLPRISNFTDFDPLLQERDVVIRYVRDSREWGDPDVVIIPGSKNTVEDLLFLRESGLEALLLHHMANGGRVIGICAGYQMMGTRLLDPDLVESDLPVLPGLSVFPMETTFAKEKRTERVTGSLTAAGFGGVVSMNEAGTGADADAGTHADAGVGTEANAVAVAGIRAATAAEADIPAHADVVSVEGYEIHMGSTVFLEPVVQPFLIRPSRLADEPAAYHPDGAITADGRMWGTYVHGIFHNDRFRHNWLNEVRTGKGLEPAGADEEVAFGLLREQSFDRLADHVRGHVDMERIYRIMEGWGA